MTDHIDLDDLATDDTDEQENDGDWFWRGEGAPPEDTDAAGTEAAETAAAADAAPSTDAAPTGAGSAETADAAESDAGGTDARVPHVPRTNKDQPVGIPKEGGGAGGATARDQAEARAAAESEGEEEPAEASGPHGGGADDMTLALTYEAAKRLAHPSSAVMDAERWADWVGIVGGVDAHVLNKFQRDNTLDLDFFNGAGMEPAERLADIDENSMFYAERMALVGVEGQEGIAERAGWEFVPLAEAAAKADWELTE